MLLTALCVIALIDRDEFAAYIQYPWQRSPNHFSGKCIDPFIDVGCKEATQILSSSKQTVALGCLTDPKFCGNIDAMHAARECGLLFPYKSMELVSCMQCRLAQHLRAPLRVRMR